jgi:hypothetical protein
MSQPFLSACQALRDNRNALLAKSHITTEITPARMIPLAINRPFLTGTIVALAKSPTSNPQNQARASLN